MGTIGVWCEGAISVLRISNQKPSGQIMGRSRYTFTEPDKPHFMTCTVMEWLPVFTRPDTVQIILDSWQYQRENNNLKLYGYVILENHLHFVAQAPKLDQCVSNFKSYTARQIIDYLKQRNVKNLLKKLQYAKRAHKKTENTNSGKKAHTQK